MRHLLQRLFAWCDAKEDSELSGVLLERRKEDRRRSERRAPTTDTKDDA